MSIDSLLVMSLFNILGKNCIALHAGPPINWLDKIASIPFAVIQALIIGFFTSIILNRIFLKEKNIGKKLRDYGIERISAYGDGTLSKKDANVFFGRRGHPAPREIHLCFITGNRFLQDYKEEIKKLAKNGCKIKVLIADPTASSTYNYPDSNYMIPSKKIGELANYYCEILFGLQLGTCFCERSFAMLDSNCSNNRDECIKEFRTKLKKAGDHTCQIKRITNLLYSINTENKNGNIEIRYYTDEYQMPIILAEYDTQKKREAKTRLWTNINAPVRETIESINVYSESSESRDGTFVNDVAASFNYLWNKYDKKQKDISSTGREASSAEDKHDDNLSDTLMVPQLRGKINGFAIAGFICAFVFPFIGLGLSIAAACHASFYHVRPLKGLARAGIIISAILSVLHFAMFLFASLILFDQFIKPCVWPSFSNIFTLIKEWFLTL